MKIIFETFKKCIYSPVFYQNISSIPFSSALRYYVKFIFILAVVLTTYLGISLVPQGVAFVKERAPEMVKKYFPAELTVHIEKGEVSVNVPEPYIITGKDATQAMLKSQGLENMLVIDTKNDFDKNKFIDYKTLVLLTKNEMVTQNNNGQITIQDLHTFPSSTVNQEWLLSWVEKTQRSIGYIVFFGMIATFLLVYLGYLKYVVVLLLFALVPYLVARLKKIKISYSTAYKVSLYAVLPALALKTVLNVMGIFYMPAYFTFIVFMLIVAVNMREVAEPTLFENN